MCGQYSSALWINIYPQCGLIAVRKRKSTSHWGGMTFYMFFTNTLKVHLKILFLLYLLVSKLLNLTIGYRISFSVDFASETKEVKNVSLYRVAKPNIPV
jgi:hypothetical protein